MHLEPFILNGIYLNPMAIGEIWFWKKNGENEINKNNVKALVLVIVKCVKEKKKTIWTIGLVHKS